MFTTWGNTIVTILGTVAVLTPIFEWYGGKELNGSVKRSLDSWWRHLAKIKLPTVGLAEAQFALGIIHSLFGSGAFSAKRAFRCLMFVFLICTVVILIQPHIGATLRMLSRSSLRIVFIDAPLLTAWTWISIFLTSKILELAVASFARSRFGTLLFFLTLIYSTVCMLIINALLVFWAIIFISALPTQDDLLVMLGWKSDSVLDAATDEARGLAIFHFTLQFILLVFRPALLVSFVSWVLAGWIMRWIRLTIFRLSEQEKGVLTTVALALSAVGGLVLKYGFK